MTPAETLAAAETRLAHARAEMLEITIAERRRDLVPRADASRLLTWIASEALSGLGDSHHIRCSDLRTRLQAAVDAAQRHLSEI